MDTWREPDRLSVELVTSKGTYTGGAAGAATAIWAWIGQSEKPAGVWIKIIFCLPCSPGRLREWRDVGAGGENPIDRLPCKAISSVPITGGLFLPPDLL
jgi:hypothetical protein